MSYPENFARFYDVIYAQLRTVDREYFLKNIRACNGPVLEIGVGTGRFFLDALAAGADIYGIDVSENMLRELHRKIDASQRHRVSLQDARSMKLDKRFDLAVAPFRVLSHIIEADDQLRLLNSVYDHLTPGGRFIFDLYVPDLRIVQNGINEQVDFAGEYAPGRRLTRTISSRSDLLRQVSNVRMTLQWDEADGTKSETWNLEMRYYFRYELEHLVKRSRLTLTGIYGDYSEGALGEDSKDFVVVCQRDR